MNDTNRDVDVAVVGGGVIGCIVAHELAIDHDVLVLERDGVASGATGLSAGIVAPTLFYADAPAVARISNRFFRAFDGTGSFSFTERPRLDFKTDAERADAEAVTEDLARDGFPVRYLDAETVEANYDRISMDGFAGAVEYGDTGWVDPYSLATALAGATRERGGRVETGCTVDSVERTRSGFRLETTEGRYDADTVVIAAGWATSSFVDVPILPYRTQCVVIEPNNPLDDAFPIGRVASEHLYFRPEHNGGLLVGGGHRIIDDPAAASAHADESLVLELSSFVPAVLSGFDDAGLVNDWAGVDAATPDGRPIVDEIEDGLFAASGFNGLGVMTAPVAATGIRGLLGGDVEFDLDRFAADRFGDVDEDFDLHPTSEQ